MNLLEHYIKEVISIEDVPRVDWIDKKFLKVRLIADCYGDIREYERWFGEEEWEMIKEQGYFMA
jgi:hypothetical protein